jgi:hypothetical protein
MLVKISGRFANFSSDAVSHTRDASWNRWINKNSERSESTRSKTLSLTSVCGCRIVYLLLSSSECALRIPLI